MPLLSGFLNTQIVHMLSPIAELRNHDNIFREIIQAFSRNIIFQNSWPQLSDHFGYILCLNVSSSFWVNPRIPPGPNLSEIHARLRRGLRRLCPGIEIPPGAQSGEAHRKRPGGPATFAEQRTKVWPGRTFAEKSGKVHPAAGL